MSTNINTNTIPQLHTSYQSLPAGDRARVESHAVEANIPYAPKTQPALPTRAAPETPGTSPTVSLSSAIDDSLIAKSDDKGTSTASKLGAKVGVAKEVALTFLQKVVRSIVCAAKLVVGTVKTGVQKLQDSYLGLFASKPAVSVSVGDDDKADLDAK